MNLCKEIISKDNYGICTRFKVDSRKCQNPDHYESYIRYDALQSVKDGMGTTYLYINALENGARDLMGYISLRFSSYIKDYGESKKFGFSALEIAELAVSLEYAGRGIGTDMVIDAIGIAAELNMSASIKYIVLCADKTAVSFYSRSPLLFQKMSCLEEIPREHYNLNCVPMFIKLR